MVRSDQNLRTGAFPASRTHTFAVLPSCLFGEELVSVRPPSFAQSSLGQTTPNSHGVTVAQFLPSPPCSSSSSFATTLRLVPPNISASSYNKIFLYLICPPQLIKNIVQSRPTMKLTLLLATLLTTAHAARLTLNGGFMTASVPKCGMDCLDHIGCEDTIVSNIAICLNTDTDLI